MIEYVQKNYITEKKYKAINNSEHNNINWFNIIEERKSYATQLDLRDKAGINLWFNYTDKINNFLPKIHEISTLSIEDKIPACLKEYLEEKYLLDETLGSINIDGVSSTRDEIIKLVSEEKISKNINEIKAMNNYASLKFILENYKETLSHDFIINVWKIITNNTLKPDEQTEGYRNDKVLVFDTNGDCIHEGMKFDEIPNSMENLIDFINKENKIDPVIKAIIFHYHYVYLHPFFNGNGRSARVLMNHILISNDMDFFKYISISNVLKHKKDKYNKTIKICEDSESDITYFIEFYLELIIHTINIYSNNFINNLGLSATFRILRNNHIELNNRQLKILNKLFLTEKIKYDLKKFKKDKIQAKVDFGELVDYGILKENNINGNISYYLEDIDKIISNLREL